MEIDWRLYENKRLVNWRMEEWELSSSIAQTVRVRGDDQLHGRNVFAVSPESKSEEVKETKEPFFFLGLHRDVLLALVRQDLKMIADFRYEERHIKAEINEALHTLYQHPSGLIISSVADSTSVFVDDPSNRF